MRYMLDTNMLIYALRRPRDPVVTRIAAQLPGGVCISAITYAELMYGVRKSADPDRNLTALRQLLAPIPILPFGTTPAEQAGALFAYLDSLGQRIGDRDVLIAAHALAERLTLVTNNTREFARVPGLWLEDWVNRS